jgi:hypothetical protein
MSEDKSNSVTAQASAPTGRDTLQSPSSGGAADNGASADAVDMKLGTGESSGPIRKAAASVPATSNESVRDADAIHCLTTF